ncbi:cation-translocating P-type ATPase [Methylococcus capsulatus]|uniref:cation-translocating P-type ATPase n=1 Tax=Methylococcus capsulatus TaxID=414 RepID=UPI00030AB78C|nr:cation-translocating P-type ATPase [Methylococcus capsulatus]
MEKNLRAADMIAGFRPPRGGRVSVLRMPAPDRLRVKVSGLYRCDDLQRALEALPAQAGALRMVSANPVTGNALVVFDPQCPLDAVLAALERCALDHGAPFVGAAASRPVSGKGPARPDHRRNGRPAAAPRPKLAAVIADTVRNKESWHALDAEEVLSRLSANRDGLGAAVVAERLARYGRNVLTEIKPRSAVAMFLGQFASPPVALLGLSAAVSIATGGMADAVVIVGVVLINAVIGYFTEAQAQKTIDALGKIGPTHALVMRDGVKRSVPLEEVVPGDILVLSPGSYIAADARLLASNRLTVDESALTGESLPVDKRHTFVGTKDTPLGDRKNMLHMGTIVTGGSGRAIVVATGRHTEIGLIQSLVGEVKTPETPLQRQLDEMGKQLALASSGICAFVFGLGVLRGAPALQMLKTAISLAVAAVPEGLPTVATSTLALGIREMKKRHVLIRQLPSVESLGSVQTLCLDKTGTLTENCMRVVSLRTPELDIGLSATGEFRSNGRTIRPAGAEDLRRLMQVVCLCSEVQLNGDPDRSVPPGSQRVDAEPLSADASGRSGLEGSPTEMALVEMAMHAGEDVAALRRSLPLIKTVHRAEGRPYMLTVHDTGGEEHLIAVKGSPTHVLALCDRRMEGGGVPVPLDDDTRAAIVEQNELMAGQALRVLGVAYGHCRDTSTAAVSEKLVWLGMVGMEDTMRPGMAELMAQFHDAGIDTVMITGDQSATAFAFGSRLNLNDDKPLEIVDSTNLDELDPDVLKGIVRDTTVFARVAPAQKLRIVQALQANGRVVAMTGDGINDGPALKAADVGVALGNGSDVARSVADVVLEDDNLHTMIIAVQQGRTIYRNIRKSLAYLLSGNLAEIEIMLVATAIGAGEALNPMQLLWINLVTDILPAVGLSLEPPESDVLKEKPRAPNEKIFRREDLLRLLRQSLVISAGTLGVYGYGLARYGLGPAASTHAFMALTVGQMFHAISCRSERTTVLEKRAGNPVLVSGVAATVALQAFAAVFPPLRGLLRLTPIGPADWAAIAAGSVLPFVANEAIKLLPSREPESENRA